jgi:hypothetical protein
VKVVVDKQKLESGKSNGNKHVNSHHITAVWRDWGFSGISVFLLPLR